MTGASRHHQQGAALLLLFLVLFVSGAGVVLAAANNRSPQLSQDATVRQEMIRARDALLAYALTYPENSASGLGPGRLPCPDTDNDGASNAASCALLGRLPVAEVLSSGTHYMFSDFGRGRDRGFWYALSPEFRADAPMVNSSTSSTLSLDDMDDVVALILASGEPLAGQQRPSNAAMDYLEAGNGHSLAFVTTGSVDPDDFNDSVLVVRRSELMSLVTPLVAGVIHQHLEGRGSYPATLEEFALLAAEEPDWWITDGWVGAVKLYEYESPETVTLSFEGCAIRYRLTHGVSLQRDGSAC